MAGPQLVVPIMNARFALNAANDPAGARCMTRSTAPTPSPKRTAPPRPGYNEIRGNKVIAYARNFSTKLHRWKPARTSIPPAIASKAASWSFR